MVRIFFTLSFIFSQDIAFAQSKAEKLKVFWPEEYNWKIVAAKYERKITFEYLIPKKEKVKGWSILGIYVCVPNKPNYNVDTTIKEFLIDMKKNYGDSRVKILEQDSVKHSWALIQVEEMFDRATIRQISAIYYIRVGKYNYFEASIRIRGRDLPAGFSDKWAAIFKKSEMYYDF